MTGTEDTLRAIAKEVESLAGRLRRIETLPLQRTWVEIADAHLTVPAADITFSAISQNWGHLRIVGLLRSNWANVGESVGVHFNGDVGNNYTSGRARMHHPAVLVTSERISDTFMSLTGVVGDLSPAGCFGVVDYFIPNYTVAGINKSIVAMTHSVNAYAPAGPQVEISGGTWIGGAINSVRFFPAAGGPACSWVAGSRLILFGIG